MIAALGVSLIEAFVILPAHLGHIRERPQRPRRLLPAFEWVRGLREIQTRFLDERFPRVYERVLRIEPIGVEQLLDAVGEDGLR